MADRIDIQELREAASKATKGPWQADGAEVWGTHAMRFNLTSGGTPKIADLCKHEDCERPFPYQANAAHIANCDPDTILALCAVVEAAQKALDALDGGTDYDRQDAAEALRAALQPFKKD